MLAGILWTIVVVLVVLWLIGFLVVHVGGGLIHLLLVIAVIVLLYNLFVGRRRATSLGRSLTYKGENDMKSNIRVPEEVQDAGREANRTARNAASSRWMTIFARLGYAAKGVVYLIIGWLAVQVAIGAGGKTTDQRGALQTIYEQPFGKFLLALVIIGLLGFAIWCFLQAWFDTEGKGRDIKGIIGRLGYAVTGVSYAILAFGAFQLVTRTGTSSATKSTTASTQDVTAQLLNHSWGVAVVVILGSHCDWCGLLHVR